MSTNVIYIALGGAGLISLLSIIGVFVLNTRLKKIMNGKTGRDIEEGIVSIDKKLLAMENNEEMLAEAIENLDKRLRSSIRSVEMTRFNPFEDQGGNHSFAISMVNERGDGVVISSLYSRERMSVFAKHIKKGKSDIDLTEEEQDVLSKGLVSIKE
ncbi:MAG: hypothetical protein RL641_739 [Candidatus Parcubacteria bacterium]|jgi:uncharacterized protein YlxW (UPF0749 family)